MSFKFNRQFVCKLIGVFILTANVSTANAASQYPLQIGSDLESVCAAPQNMAAPSQDEKDRLQVCGSYIRGFLGYYAIVRQNLKEPTFCLPAQGISAERIRVPFLELLKQKPQLRDLPANIDLAASVTWAFPCGDKPTTK